RDAAGPFTRRLYAHAVRGGRGGEPGGDAAAAADVARRADADRASLTTRNPLTAEEERLQQARDGKGPWGQGGPFLSERQWGTVREDYSPNGTAWEYLPHDHARSRAYRWGED